MSSVLKNVLRFTGLVVGVPTAQAHSLNYNGKPSSPQMLWANGSGFTISVDAMQVTVTRNADGAAAVDVMIELWHSIENAQPPGGIPTGYLPFVMQGGSSSGGSLPDPTTLSMSNGIGTPLVRGTPVRIFFGTFAPANRYSADAASVVGLISVAADPALIGVAQVVGALTMTTAEWDVITGQVGGLTPNAIYYLAAASGKLSATAPVTPGEFLAEVGRAVTTTVMLINLEPPTLL